MWKTDDILVVNNIHGEQERVRVLWPLSNDRLHVMHMDRDKNLSFRIPSSAVIAHHGTYQRNSPL